MNPTLRPFVTAGIAVVGAGMITVTPVATPLLEAQMAHDVALTADIDFTGAWADAFNTAEVNFEHLQTALQDANSALSDALSNADLSNLDLEQLGAALTFLGGDQKGFLNPLAEFTTSLPSGDGGLGSPDFFLGNFLLYGLLSNQGEALAPGLIPAIPDPIPEIVQVLASPLSGLLIGALGPSLSPLVALINSVEAISANLGGDNPDTTAALQELINIPANMVNGLLNGATLNLDFLIPTVTEAGLLPEGVGISGLSFAFGGLLSPGEVGGTIDALSAAELPPPIFGGGSILNALGITVSVTDPLTLDLTFGPGQGVGLTGALAGLEQVLALLLTGDLDFDGPPPEVEPDPGAATDFDFGALLADLFGGAQ
ncbi:outer membrane porin GjpA [Mycolicibacter minnesotensis]